MNSAPGAEPRRFFFAGVIRQRGTPFGAPPDWCALYLALGHGPLRLPVKLLGLWDEPMPRRCCPWSSPAVFPIRPLGHPRVRHQRNSAHKGRFQGAGPWGQKWAGEVHPAGSRDLGSGENKPFTTVRLRGHRTVRPYGLRQLLSFDRGEFGYKP